MKTETKIRVSNRKIHALVGKNTSRSLSLYIPTKHEKENAKIRTQSFCQGLSVSLGILLQLHSASGK